MFHNQHKNENEDYHINGIEYGQKIAKTNKGGVFLGNRVSLDTNIETGTLDFSNNYVLAISGDVDFHDDNKYVKALDINNTLDKNILNQILSEKGYRDFDLQISDLYKVDLDKDGVDEVIINADTGFISGTDGEKFGSFVFMRKVKNGVVENIILNENLFTFNDHISYSQMITYRILCFCDLNNDGVMEMIVKTNGNDHLGIHVYELQGDTFVCVLSTGGVSA